MKTIRYKILRRIVLAAVLTTANVGPGREVMTSTQS